MRCGKFDSAWESLQVSGPFAFAVVVTCGRRGRAETNCKFPFPLEVIVCRIPPPQELQNTLTKDPALLATLYLETIIADEGGGLDVESNIFGLAEIKNLSGH